MAEMRWVADSSRPSFEIGSRAYEQRSLFAEWVHPGRIVFDIGANSGYYTAVASILTGPTGRVFAFEPLPRNLYFLNRHVELNHLNNVSIMGFAVADVDGEYGFEAGRDSSKGHLSEVGDLHVRTVSLDAMIASGRLPAPHVMRIHVKRAELRVLHGARQTLLEARPAVFLTTHGQVVHDACCKYLAELGYRLERIGEPAPDGSGEVLARAV